MACCLLSARPLPEPNDDLLLIAHLAKNANEIRISINATVFIQDNGFENAYHFISASLC